MSKEKIFDGHFHVRDAKTKCKSCGEQAVIKANDAKKPTIECYPCRVAVEIL